MADIDRAQGAPIPATMVTRYKDMGDGTHALQTASVSLGTLPGSDATQVITFEEQASIDRRNV